MQPVNVLRPHFPACHAYGTVDLQKGEIIRVGLIYSTKSWKVENAFYLVAEEYIEGDMGETLS